MIDGERLWNRLFELAEIGKQEDGGVTRLSFTEEERAAKELVASYMDEAGLSVYEDAVGNLFGRREGRSPDAPWFWLDLTSTRSTTAGTSTAPWAYWLGLRSSRR